MAFLFVLIAMLGYIWLRFWSVAFAVGAVVSLIHDAVVIVAAFLLLDREVSSNLIFAVLTMLGYSINDTIIIFARIREHLRTMPGRPIEEIVTLSINQTLRRTILTSFATSLTVLAMLLLGGEALRDLSIALMIGIVFGTYSSIYIASPVMIMLYRGTKEHAPAH
jgi:preprotein translocase SecF subunit